MPASNIKSVTLETDGSVTIVGSFTKMGQSTVTLLHIWLSQSTDDKNEGVGLAISALDSVKNNRWTKNAAPDNGRFRAGPATVSAISVISADAAAGTPQNVLQWTRTLTLVEGIGEQVNMTISV